MSCYPSRLYLNEATLYFARHKQHMIGPRHGCREPQLMEFGSVIAPSLLIGNLFCFLQVQSKLHVKGKPLIVGCSVELVRCHAPVSTISCCSWNWTAVSASASVFATVSAASSRSSSSALREPRTKSPGSRDTGLLGLTRKYWAQSFSGITTVPYNPLGESTVRMILSGLIGVSNDPSLGSDPALG